MGFATSLGLVGATLMLATIAVNGDTCPSGDVNMPSNFAMEDAAKYTYKEAGLQIYTNLRIPCDGYLTEFRFIASNSLVYGLHIGIFRPQAAAGVVMLAAQSYLQALTTPNGVGGVWIYYPVDPSIQVRTGDYIGIFYDKFKTQQDLLTIVSKITTDTTFPPTYVFLMDDGDMKKNSTLDFASASKIYRIPALTAVISNAMPTTTPNPEEAIATMPDQEFRCDATPTALQVCAQLQMRAYYDKNLGECRPFFGCESWNDKANNFNNLEECIGICFMGGYTTLAPMAEECYVTPSASTSCNDPGIRYYYDRERRICASFYGCALAIDPPANNFETIDGCRRKCRVPQPGTDDSVLRTPARPKVVISVQAQQSDILPFIGNARYLFPPAVDPYLAQRQ